MEVMEEILTGNLTMARYMYYEDLHGFISAKEWGKEKHASFNPPMMVSIAHK